MVWERRQFEKRNENHSLSIRNHAFCFVGRLSTTDTLSTNFIFLCNYFIYYSLIIGLMARLSELQLKDGMGFFSRIRLSHFTNYFEIKGTTELPQEHSESFALLIKNLDLNPYMGCQSVKSSWNIMLHPKSLCHKNTEKSFIWNYNEEVWQAQPLWLHLQDLFPWF